MKKGFALLSGAVFASVLTVTAQAQKMTTMGPGNGGSPHVKTEWTMAGANVSIAYGRPYLKGRAESTMMPVGKEWRTGADEATVITSDKPLKIGSISVPAGTYTLNTQPGKTEWQLIVGKLGKPGQWGVPYQPALEMSRTPMTLTKLKAPVEQVTYSIDKTATGGTLRVEWGTQSASVPIVVSK